MTGCERRSICGYWETLEREFDMSNYTKDELTAIYRSANNGSGKFSTEAVFNSMNAIAAEAEKKLTSPEPEPVAWMADDEFGNAQFVEAHYVKVAHGQFPFDNPIPLYTTPQPAPDTTPPELEQTGRSLIVVQRVWVQVSADYDAAERTRTISVTPDTTVGEVMRWAAAAHVLGRGDVILTEQD